MLLYRSVDEQNENGSELIDILDRNGSSDFKGRLSVFCQIN